MPDRDGIRANAQYLRNVRPVDPEEIHEYVDGQPHPAVVKRVLREEAVDLGLREREDGTFVPVSDEPVPVPELPVTEFPECYGRRLEDLLVETYGTDWHRGDSGDALRDRLRGLKRSYHRGWDVEYDEEAALAYAIYHLPDYYAAVQYVLAELAEVGALDRTLRILDVGAGVGGPMLGIVDALPDDALLQYDAIEPSASADVLEAMLEETGRNVHHEIHRTTAEAFELPGDAPANVDCDPADSEPADSEPADSEPADSERADRDDAADGADDSPDEYDLVLFGNVLVELDDPIGTAERYFDAVADDGAMLLLSPADRGTTRALRIVERALADGTWPEGADELVDRDGDTDGGDCGGDESDADGSAENEDDRDGTAATSGEPTDTDAGRGSDRTTVFSPTVRLWPHESPTDEGWSFVARPDLAVPPFQKRLDDAAGSSGEYVNVDVQYSYAILRHDGRRRIEYTPDRSRWAKLGESDEHVSQRVDCVAVKLSGDLSEGGNQLYKIGDGSEAADHFAVLTRETSLNESLRGAEYGDLLTFESVLVLWNEDERAFNLVVDDETVVDVAPAPIQ